MRFGNFFKRMYESGNGPLHIAVAHNDVDAVRFLLKSGVNPNALNVFGQHPLMCSVRSKFEIHRLLIEAGASVKRKDCMGNTLFDYGFSKSSLELFRLAEQRKYLFGFQKLQKHSFGAVKSYTQVPNSGTTMFAKSDICESESS